jgi:pyruvate, orthophosphate dikinase
VPRRPPRPEQPVVLALADAAGLDRALIGGKAASLVELTGLGLRVPPAFVITTEVWRDHRATGHLAATTVRAIDDAVAGLEAATGRRFGGTADPLLLSVRSGGAASMPGMMDTLLDVGFGPGTRAALAATADDGFARRCHARFLAGYATVVLGTDVPGSDDPDALAAALAGRIPDDPEAQLRAAVEAVLRSWDNERAQAYREHQGIDHDLGTAVVVQAMVFGDRGPASGSGVAFSRHPDTGAPGLCGDFLPGAQGPDVADGGHRPLAIDALARIAPRAFADLERAIARIEALERDLVDVELTVEEGDLYLLQHRPGARAAAAAVRVAVDLVDEGWLSVAEAIGRVPPAQLALASRATVAPRAGEPLATGLGACPGVAVGEVCLSADHVAEHGGPVVLVRAETSPEDVVGMTASAGVLTAKGGLVSHAALLARELDLPAVVGVVELEIDEVAGTITVGRRRLREGDLVTVDGATGRVHAGQVDVVQPAPSEHLARFRRWLPAEHQPG